jgi:hypothetical protein
VEVTVTVPVYRLNCQNRLGLHWQILRATDKNSSIYPLPSISSKPRTINMPTVHSNEASSYLSVSCEERIDMATTMVRHGTTASGSSTLGQSVGLSCRGVSDYQWRVTDVGEAIEVAPSTIYHRLRGRLRREEAHQYQQKLTLGEEQAIVTG